MYEQETHANSPGGGQTLTFLVVATIVGVPCLLLGGPLVGYFAFLLFGFLFINFFAGKIRRLCLFIYLFLAVCLLVGGLVYSTLDSGETATRTGEWPLIGPLFKYTAVKALLAVVAGVVGGVLAVDLPLRLIVLISAEWILALRESYGLDRKLATSLVRNLALGIGRARVIVDEGEIKDRHPQGPLDRVGAPAVVVVKPYNAVVMVRGGKISRIEGPGLVRLQNEEEIQAVVDLHPQSGPYEVSVVTKDNVPLKVKGGLAYRIESRDEARARGDRGNLESKDFDGVIDGPYPVFRHTVYQAVFNVSVGTDWKKKTESKASSKVRDVIRDYTLEEIFPLDGSQCDKSILNELAAKAKELAQKDARNWGVTVYGVGINEIEMPEKVRERLEAEWQKHIERIRAESAKMAEVIRAEGTSQVLSSLEQIKLKTIEALMAQILQGIQAGGLMQNPRVANRFIAALERLARNVVTDDRSAVRLTEMLDRLAPSKPPRFQLVGSQGRFSGEDEERRE
jgi:regulator of protease activity HflC (stomatin/prohibitin superfamily)